MRLLKLAPYHFTALDFDSCQHVPATLEPTIATDIEQCFFHLPPASARPQECFIVGLILAKDMWSHTDIRTNDVYLISYPVFVTFQKPNQIISID